MSNVRRRMSPRYASLAPALALLLAGCIPLPHVQQTEPELDGVLTGSATPLAAIPVRFCVVTVNTQPCSASRQTSTDEQGRFHFDSQGALEAFLPLRGEPSYVYRIDLTYGGSDHSWSYANSSNQPRHVALHCELSTALVCTHEP